MIRIVGALSLVEYFIAFIYSYLLSSILIIVPARTYRAHF